jgi:molybdenum cofactor guanylyltransferase
MELGFKSMTKRAAIILAGGKGERFQSLQKKWQDKALVLLFGKPLLVHAIENVREAVDEIVVCVNDEKRRARDEEVLRKYGLEFAKLVVDEKCGRLGGPLVGILTGLKSVNADYCLTLPGDMPLMQQKVIQFMFERIEHSRVVVPMWPNGRLETLSMVLEKSSALKIAQTLCLLERPRSDDLIRGALNVTFLSVVGEIASLDPELKSFININRPEDLSKLRPRRVDGAVKESLHVRRGNLPTAELQQIQEASILRKDSNLLEASKVFSLCADQLEKENSLFWAAVSRENEGKSLLRLSETQPEFSGQAAKARQAILKAGVIYGLEADMHEECSCFFLAERARSDKEWCVLRANKPT